MANSKITTKSRRQPQPAKPAIRWVAHYNNRPDSPLQQRRLIRRALLSMDDQAVRTVYSIVMTFAVDSQQRADAAELAHIKATCAIIPAKKVPASELIALPLKRKAHGKAVRP